ncbi:hypothetical protein WBG78_01105 [Chryseolinea sp. T2]|uniref:hypothetical protein n=1 Tax=Chryseolinea sp. T2 TaxID=3129255 RepID=UPI0030780F5C
MHRSIRTYKEELAMIRDINIPEVKNVTLAVARNKYLGQEDEWKVYLINNNDHPLENTLVSSKGYGEKNGETQRTSILRHFLETIPPMSTTLIEPIDPAVFHLNNEYWLSYYVGTQIFDKRFVFVPDSICEKNISFIRELELEGVLHS